VYVDVYSPKGEAKPQTIKKDDDVYEMAIQYKKNEDFSGWYTDVSCPVLVYEDEADMVIGPDQRSNAGLL
jgi:hypothetical protein